MSSEVALHQTIGKFSSSPYLSIKSSPPCRTITLSLSLCAAGRVLWNSYIHRQKGWTCLTLALLSCHLAFSKISLAITFAHHVSEGRIASQTDDYSV